MSSWHPSSFGVTEGREMRSSASSIVGDKSDILYLCIAYGYFIKDSVTITGDSYKGGVMKFGVVMLFGFMSVGCAVEQQSTVVQESFFVPVIRSDYSSSGYTPSITPASQPQEESPRIYTPVLR
ncbi:hypothetical protein OAH87_04850 [Marinomonas sp.]|nr:hypothetical protein [Marinomonas sp.]